MGYLQSCCIDVRLRIGLYILSRGRLNIHQGIRVQGLPSAEINNQVEKLQDEVKTHMGKPFVKVSGAGLDDSLESIDFISWLTQVGKFGIDWDNILPKYYPLYVAILFGLVLARLGKVVQAGTPISCVIRVIVEQYQRGDGLLPDPKPKSTFPSRPPPPSPSIIRPVVPRYSQLCTGELSAWAPAIMALLLLLVIMVLLLLVMSTLVALQLELPRGARPFQR